MARGDELSQESEDAIVTKLMQRMSEKGIYGDVMAAADRRGDRKVIEDSMERHGARMRKAGKPGW